VFLVGGPAFSGTTLLTHLLNQGSVVCLDEPDFHNPEQRHRGVPFLMSLFPDRKFPDRAKAVLSYDDAVDWVKECEEAITPFNLGIKLCNLVFIEYAKLYKDRHWPVITIVRDIRDALIRPLPPWLSEQGLSDGYQLIWRNRNHSDLWVRYEDLVINPVEVLGRISKVLGVEFKTPTSWGPETVHKTMFKDERHEMLKRGVISRERMGLWRTSGKVFSAEIEKTARMMGYTDI